MPTSTAIRCLRCVRAGRAAPALAMVGPKGVAIRTERLGTDTTKARAETDGRFLGRLPASKAVAATYDQRLQTVAGQAARTGFRLLSGQQSILITCPLCHYKVRRSAASLRKLATRNVTDEAYL